MGSNLSDSEMTASGLEGPSLAAASLSRDWQPIETAPKDGRWLKVLSAKYVLFEKTIEPGEHKARWSDGGEVWECERGFFDPHEVTHWMPLPDPSLSP
jgi:hypothetical protein